MRPVVQRLDHLAGIGAGNQLDSEFRHNALVAWPELHVLAHGFLQFLLTALASEGGYGQASASEVEDLIVGVARRFGKRLAGGSLLSVARHFLRRVEGELLCRVFLHVAEGSAVGHRGYDGYGLSAQLFVKLLPSHALVEQG